MGSSSAPASKALLQPGKNSWKLAGASRVAPLVDAKAYFEAVAWAAERAEHTLFFLCWDIDSRISLLPDAKENGDYWSEPASRNLADFLLHLVETKPNLRIYILCWDFLFFYANEREGKKEAIRRFTRHPRIHFHFDSTGPFLVSHHQKMVVADDQVAFNGGLDITQRRWDTPEHRVERALRTDPTGRRYEPFHDVQLAVEGEAARDLGRLCRERWKARTGVDVPLAPGEPDPALWPPFLEPMVEHARVAISRTIPSHRAQPEVRECFELFADMIRAARDYIYIENQYLTSAKIGALLEERLREANPPEIVILLRQHDSKWTEAISMSLLRTRLVRRLRAADRHGRLRVLCPWASREANTCINLHSKVFIADDRVARVGSANLCGRSEGMDTECDVTVCVEGEGEGEKRASIRAFRDRLLAEHLGITPGEAAAALAENPSMLALIERYQYRRDKTVHPCQEPTKMWLELIAPSRGIVDPESPRQLMRSIRHLFAGLFVAVAILTAFLVLPSPDYQGTLTAWAAMVAAQPLAPVGMTLTFALLTFLGCPLIPLTVAFALLLPPLETFLYAMVGALLSSTLVYLLPRSGFLRTLAESERLEKAREALSRQGFWPVVVVRLLPVAPFWLMNFAMGALGVKFRHYLPATFLGLLPGFLAIAWLEDKARAQGSVSLLAAYLAAFLAFSWAVQRGLRKLLE